MLPISDFPTHTFYRSLRFLLGWGVVAPRRPLRISSPGWLLGNSTRFQPRINIRETQNRISEDVFRENKGKNWVKGTIFNFQGAWRTTKKANQDTESPGYTTPTEYYSLNSVFWFAFSSVPFINIQRNKLSTCSLHLSVYQPKSIPARWDFDEISVVLGLKNSEISAKYSWYFLCTHMGCKIIKFL